MTQDSRGSTGLNERHLIRSDESSRLKIWRDAIAGVLTHGDGRVQMDTFLHHLEQRRLLRPMIFETKTTPGEHLENVIEGCWSQIDTIAPRGDDVRWPLQDLELLCRLGDLTRKDGGLPDEPSIARLDGLIALIINTPIAVEGKAFKPVPLSERIGKAGVNTASRVNADQISTTAGVKDSSDGISPIGETVFPLLHGGVHVVA